MSDNEYDEDFDAYDEDFESDNDLEVPDQPQRTNTIAGAADDIWPSLTASAAVKQKPRAATFTRSLITGVTGPGATLPATTDGVSYCISPAAPPLTDTQRSRASKTLNRSLQQHKQVKLSLTPAYELLLLQPMSTYQQLTLGVGAFAGRVAAASQTRQMDQKLHEQDVQTEEVESQDGSCQVPDAAPSSSSSSSSSRGYNRSTSTTTAAAANRTATAAASKLLDSDAVAEFLEWAVPEAIFELSKAAAAAAAAAAETKGSRAAGAHRGLPFEPSSISQTVFSSSSRISSTRVSGSQPQLIAGQVMLQSSSLLSGRSVLAVACPSNAAAATAITAAISAATAAAAISSHLLLCCCSPVAMSAEAALQEHGLPGLGCLCIWDLQHQQQQRPQQQGVTAAAAAGGSSHGGGALVQLLVTDGRPTCCCWGAGAGCSLVFAGMDEGGVCCWDLSEPDSTHKQQQQSPSKAPQQQQHWPTPRRPSYSSQVPLTMLEDTFNNTAGSSSNSSAAFDAALFSSVDSIVAVAAVAPSAGSASAAGGAVCQLITLSSSCNVVLYSVMMGVAGAAAAAAGGTDLGMRSGSRVWLVKLLEGLPLGVEAAKPPHLRSPPTAAAAAAAMQATSLLHLPGASQQILVGLSSSCILRGACLGTPPPPRHYTAAKWELLGFGSQGLGPGPNNTLGQKPGSFDRTAVTGSNQSFDSSVSSCLGSVVSLRVCPVVPEAWLAGFSSGGIGLFSIKKSRPVLMWQQLRPAGVIAARWIPPRPCVFVVLHADGQLLAFDLSQDTKQPSVMANLQRTAAASATNSNHSSNTAVPCSMEVLVHSSSSTSAVVPAANNSKDMRSRTSGKGSRRSTAESQGGTSTAAAQCSVAVGYDDGVTVVYQLGMDWSSSQQQDEEQLLLQLLAT